MKTRYKLLAGLLLMLLCFAAFGVYSIQSAANALHDAREEEFLRLMDSVTDGINYRTHQALFFLEEVGTRRLVQSELRQGGLRISDAEWASGGGLIDEVLRSNTSIAVRSLQSFLDERKEYSSFAEIFVTDRFGAIVGASEKTSDYWQNDEEWWVSAMEKRVFVREFVFDESARQFGLMMAARIDGADGRPLGVIKGIFNFEGLMEQFARAQLGEDIEIKIVSPEGKMLYSTKYGFEFFGIDYSQTEVFKRALGAKGFFLAADDEGGGEKGFYGYKWITQHDEAGEWFSWLVVVDYAGQAPFEYEDGLKKTAVVFFVVMLCIAFGIGLVVHSSVSRPVEQLTQVIDDISTGKLETEVPVELKNSKDEIGSLARAFDRTVYSLKLAMNVSRKDKKR